MSTIILLIFAVIACTRCGQCVLLYPASTVFQIISSISLPITDLVPLQKVFLDCGFQMNYDMPFNLSSFYMVPIWSSRGHAIMAEREVHAKDYTVDEFYGGLENFLERWGLHSSCLKRTICELVQHPFEATHLSLITDLLTYLLTPSLIDVSPRAQRNDYRMAEIQGFSGYECHQQYPECVDSLLNAFTEINYS